MREVIGVEMSGDEIKKVTYGDEIKVVASRVEGFQFMENKILIGGIEVGSHLCEQGAYVLSISFIVDNDLFIIGSGCNSHKVFGSLPIKLQGIIRCMGKNKS